jgi:hypothetical protein
LPASGIWGSRSDIIHWTVWCNTGLSGVLAEQRLLRANGRLQGTVKANSARLRAQKSEQAPEGASDSDQDLSGAPPDCPVAQLSEAPTVRTQRPGDVAGAPNSVRWRTGLSGAPYDRSLHQQPYWWLGLQIPPNHLSSRYPSIHYTSFNTKAIHNTPRHKSKPPIESKSPIQL